MGSLRFAAHLGFPNPQQPLFGAAAGTTDPVRQIAFVAQHGLAGVLDPFSAMRSPEEQAQIGIAAADAGLAMGGFLYLPFDAFRTARWGSADPDIRRELIVAIGKAIGIAKRLGSRHISVISVADEELDRATQYAAMAENLRFAGDLAARAGVTLCVEGLTAARLPHALLHGVEQSAQVVRKADHPSVRLLFDTAHCHASGEDVLEQAVRHWDIIEVVQLADAPGRVEMGAGEVDFGGLFEILRVRNYVALHELEHGWAEPDAVRQLAYIDGLRAW